MLAEEVGIAMMLEACRLYGASPPLKERTP